MQNRRFTWLGLGALAVITGACEILGGLSAYQEGAGAGGATTSSTSTAGATTSSSSAGTGGATTSSTSATSSSGTGGLMSSSGTSTSSSGGCDGGVLCGGQCAVNDGSNCGWCGHKCGTDSSCVGGTCTLRGLGGGYRSVSGIAATPGLQGAYWAHEHSVTQGMYYLDGVVAAGTLQTASIADKVGGIAVTADGSTVFFTSHAGGSTPGLWAWSPSTTTSSSPQSVCPGTNFTAFGAIAVAEPTHVGWIAGTGAQVGLYDTSVTVKACVSPTVAGTLNVLANDGTYFWTVVSTMLTQLSSANPSGGTPLVAQAGITHLAADGNSGGYVYMIANGKLHRILKGGSSLESPVADAKISIGNPAGLVVLTDGTYLFWLDAGTCPTSDGALWRLGWSDMAPTLVAGQLTCPSNLAQDDTTLYFANGLPGTSPGSVTVSAILE